MKLAVVGLLALAGVALAMDPECKEEWNTQKHCFWGLLGDSLGVNEGLGYKEVKNLVKKCFKDNECRLPRGGHHGHGHGNSGSSSDSDSDSDSSDDDDRRFKRDHHLGKECTKKMNKCVKEELGSNPKDAVRGCLREQFPDLNVPPMFMREYKKVSPQKSMCPYKKMLFYLNMVDDMEQVIGRFCGGDAARTQAVHDCILESTGVDMFDIDKDEVRQALCERKDECETNKLEECRNSIEEMLMAACTCKREELLPARETCAERLDMHVPEHQSMECGELFEMKKAKWDMCADTFEWNVVTPGHGGSGHAHGRTARHRRHKHADHSHDSDNHSHDEDDD